MKRRATNGPGDLNGFLDSGGHVKGELHFQDTFRVDGKVTGAVISEGELVVGEKGEIEGEIRVASVYVSGVVRGKILAATRVVVTSQGRVYAEVRTPRLAVEEGAFFQGRCAMQKRGAATARKTVAGDRPHATSAGARPARDGSPRSGGESDRTDGREGSSRPAPVVSPQSAGGPSASAPARPRGARAGGGHSGGSKVS